ncbi:hypothetical protein B7463_g8552, partial [Scytalidium lignicola]
MSPQANASHEEIWDDSMLVDSWNEALEEYRLYHSIHARGEKIEDVLKTFEESGKVGTGPEYIEKAAEHTEPNGTSLKEAAGQEGSIDHAENLAGNGPSQETEQQPTNGEQASAPLGGQRSSAQVLPQHLIGQGNDKDLRSEVGMFMADAFTVDAVQDEGLKNLLMSWYYAGYYTGLYEGQQQGRSNKQTGPPA